MHSNYGAHLSWGIQYDKEWQTQWKTLAVMPMRGYDAPIRRFGRCFVHVLAADITGIWKRHWKAKRFIIFQMVIFQRARHVTKSCEIW